jgi:flavin-binding protein dodecin
MPVQIDEAAGAKQPARSRRPRVEAESMTNRTYRVTEIVGTSPESVQQAVRNGISRAAETLRHLDWFEVTEIRGQIVDGEVEHFQVGMKVGFRLEDA